MFSALISADEPQGPLPIDLHVLTGERGRYTQPVHNHDLRRLWRLASGFQRLALAS
ncbi:hypothetical protein [Aestuariivirga litoralis]|uniref:hypothetical protein n=1 Tax=Aestuariivirga litoralis TaxID=2650924 RepID=UPI0018C5C733|nr:hypothetical protein [Aestuariivirga litoralis]